MTEIELALKELKEIKVITRENNKQLIIINGGQKRNTEDILSLKKRMREIEALDLKREGFEEGEKSMKTSTKIIIGFVLTGIGLLFAGITVFQLSNRSLIAKVEAGMGDRFTGQDGQALMKRLEAMEIIVNHENGEHN